MDFKVRNRIVQQFSDWEQRYDVANWKIDGVHVWPLIKMRIFNDEFYRENRTIPKEEIKKSGRIKTALKLLGDAAEGLAGLIFLKIQKADLLYSGGDGHRVLDKQSASINRYFDPMMNRSEENNKTAVLIEYDRIRKGNFYRGDRVIPVFKIFPFFLLMEIGIPKVRRDELVGIDAFLNEVYSKFNNRNFFETIRKQVLRIRAWERLYLYLLQRTGARKVFALCYYANPMYGMTIAARKMNIESVDMQHGTQGPLHPAYSFLKAPQAGYNIIPNYFYCWDQPTYNHIKSWSHHKGIHEPILFGNPWNDFLVKHSSQFSSESLSSDPKRIVITLQPLTPPFADMVLLDVIKQTATKYSWWIRFHPRMSKNEKEWIFQQFKDYGISESVVFDDSYGIPLPLLFAASRLHISRYSGAISEAATTNLKSIILDEIGVNSYREILEGGMAIDGANKNVDELKHLIEEQMK